MIHGDTILMAGNGCDLRTGKRTMRKDPLTGEAVEWTWTRGYGCNTPLASEYLLTFRSGAAGYYDLCNDGGTGNLGGFRSSCTNNLIVAGGVLCAPDYTRTCTCSYQIQSSVALVSGLLQHFAGGAAQLEIGGIGDRVASRRGLQPRPWKAGQPGLDEAMRYFGCAKNWKSLTTEGIFGKSSSIACGVMPSRDAVTRSMTSLACEPRVC